jgi:thiol-disulfide isomerase/thioredoxin
MRAFWVCVFLLSCKSSPPPPEFVPAPAAGEVATVVKSALADAKRDGRRLLVYVSASWCEPCQRFQDAIKAGQLQTELAGVRFLKFDRDRDEARLTAAGYGSELIPLFVFPDENGRGTARRIEGSIKGPDSVAQNTAPRLLELLAK